MDTVKPLVFISYAHLDEPDPPEQPAEGKIRWLSFVMEFLRPGVRGRKYEVWMDRLMPGGADWNPEIEAKIRACDIFVLLVSTRSTGSDYILDKEIPIIRERQRNGDGVCFYPLLLDWTPEAGLEQVNDKNLRPRDARPFSSLSPSERSRQMAEAADEIADAANGIADRKSAAAAERSEPLRTTFTAAIAERESVIAPGLRIERIAPRAGAASTLPSVGITGLPETFYERLVGRDAELARLDEAWGDEKTNILSLVAEGGAGKSALVNEWLTRLQAESYRGADCVLGWSFYSQGSKERATAADEFLNWALAKLDVKLESTTASANGEAIAEALTKRRALLVLDGVEPLQYGPGPQAGQLKDQGLRAFLRRFAAVPPRADHSLILLTSRLAVADIKRFKDGSAPVVEVARLSDEAGAELLRANDVWGIDEELRTASREFGGHPLALTLLASLLKETQNGDVRRRNHIRGLLADPDNPGHDHARRVMESYEKEWLAGHPVLLAILHCVGLFDRPAGSDSLRALRRKPAIRGLTDKIVKLDESEWRRAVARLREVRLLSPVDPSDPAALDAHPLVREWFGDRLKETNEAAWKKAHGRLYERLRAMTHEGRTPTLADLAPLYHAIAHGCRAGRHKEALHEVWVSRVCGGQTDDALEFGIDSDLWESLSAFAGSLTPIAWFFDRPFEIPTAALTMRERRWVLHQASRGLYAQGRLGEALPPLRTVLHMAEEVQNWAYAEGVGSLVSELELLVGEITAAARTAEGFLANADRGENTFRREIQLASFSTIHAEAVYAGGERQRAEGLFAAAERRQQQQEPERPLLHSVGGYRYCDLLLSQGQAAAALDRAAIDIERRSYRGLLARAIR